MEVFNRPLVPTTKKKKGRNPVAGPLPKKARSKQKNRSLSNKPTTPKPVIKTAKPVVVTPPSKTIPIDPNQTTLTQLLFKLD